ncbi:glutamate--cysteine ligase [Marinibaculum pumilum]|uniref:Glutamate--cysteine ligase n=1 Tax=Marinibaculum pumilum TaxID=1766165 RepID=A0ABV7KVS3_9PROT
MSGPSRSSPEPITDIAQLVADLESGCKPRAAWRIGTEHEKFAFDLDTLRPLPYEGEKSIHAMLSGLTRFGWEPILEGETIIGLKLDGQSVSLEPGGQFELSGAPLATLHDTCKEVNDHLHQVKAVDSELGTGVFGLGFQPKWTRADIPVMPKGRYGIMKAYMPKKGDLGLDMMFRTCTIQVNLDFESEADMVQKFRISQALQPVATALFANSPFTEGKPNGFLSYRSHIWTDTDPDRCGLLPFVHEDGMGFERYVQHVLDVPMYFVYRDGRYIDASGQSFRDFMDGRLPALPGERPTMGDWHDHLTTLFPEVRLKHYMEMRGADGGPWMRICALPALWVGLLYDSVAQDSAWQLVKDWPVPEIERLRSEVPRQGLRARIDDRTLRDVSRDVLAIAEAGLRRRGRRNASGDDESGFLDPLNAIVESGRTPAEDLLARYEKHWGGSVDPIFTEQAY